MSSFPSFPSNGRDDDKQQQINPLVAAQLRRYELRQRPALNIRPHHQSRNKLLTSLSRNKQPIPGSIGHPDADYHRGGGGLFNSYKALLVMIVFVSLLGLILLLNNYTGLRRSSRYRTNSKTTTNNNLLSFSNSYSKSDLSGIRLAEAQKQQQQQQSHGKDPPLTTETAATSESNNDEETDNSQSTSILDTLNSMGLLEEKQTADSVSSVLLVVQDATTDMSISSTTTTKEEDTNSTLHSQEDEDELLLLPNATTTMTSHLMLMSRKEQHQWATMTQTPKATVAYVIPILECDPKEPIWDGAAVLARSIILQHSTWSSNYTFKLFAIVHSDIVEEVQGDDETSATNICIENLAKLGYEILLKDNPIHPHHIRKDGFLKFNLAISAKDYIKLYAYTLVDYPIVVVLEPATFLLNPLDELFDSMLEPSGSPEAKAAKQKVNFHETGSNTFPIHSIDAYFTRDYTTLQPTNVKTKIAGFQHGFLVIKPSQLVFDEILQIVKDGTYARDMGWGHRGYGNYIGAMTTKGLLSYVNTINLSCFFFD